MSARPLVALLLLSLAASADDAARGVVDLRGGKIRDVETIVSVPIDAERSAVLGLHTGFWVQTPRYLPVPTSLSGHGMIVQFMNPRGGTPSLLYFGADPLPEAEPKETPAAREERAARNFAADLRPKYAKVDFELKTGAVTVAPTTLKVNGKKTKVWRTSRYDTIPSVPYGGPPSILSGEGVLFRPEGSEVLVYVLLDAKATGTSLDRVIANVSVVPTAKVNPAGRVVQLNDLAEGAPGRFPVRLLSYESPAGFVVGPSVRKLAGEIVYAEDRLGTDGKVSATHRFLQEPAPKDRTPEQEAKRWADSYVDRGPEPPKEIALATPGAIAWTFRRRVELEGSRATVWTAVMRFDDLTLRFEWTSFGEAAEVEKDGALFEKLVAGIQMAVRW